VFDGDRQALQAGTTWAFVQAGWQTQWLGRNLFKLLECPAEGSNVSILVFLSCVVSVVSLFV